MIELSEQQLFLKTYGKMVIDKWIIHNWIFPLSCKYKNVLGGWTNGKRETSYERACLSFDDVKDDWMTVSTCLIQAHKLKLITLDITDEEIKTNSPLLNRFFITNISIKFAWMCGIFNIGIINFVKVLVNSVTQNANLFVSISSLIVAILSMFIAFLALIHK